MKVTVHEHPMLWALFLETQQCNMKSILQMITYACHCLKFDNTVWNLSLLMKSPMWDNECSLMWRGHLHGLQFNFEQKNAQIEFKIELHLLIAHLCLGIVFCLLYYNFKDSFLCILNQDNLAKEHRKRSVSISWMFVYFCLSCCTFKKISLKNHTKSCREKSDFVDEIT